MVDNKTSQILPLCIGSGVIIIVEVTNNTRVLCYEMPVSISFLSTLERSGGIREGLRRTPGGAECPKRPELRN